MSGPLGGIFFDSHCRYTAIGQMATATCGRPGLLDIITKHRISADKMYRTILVELAVDYFDPGLT